MTYPNHLIAFFKGTAGEFLKLKNLENMVLTGAAQMRNGIKLQVECECEKYI